MARWNILVRVKYASPTKHAYSMYFSYSNSYILNVNALRTDRNRNRIRYISTFTHFLHLLYCRELFTRFTSASWSVCEKYKTTSVLLDGVLELCQKKSRNKSAIGRSWKRKVSEVELVRLYKCRKGAYEATCPFRRLKSNERRYVFIYSDGM